MRNRLICLVCLALLSTFSFAQQKAPPSGTGSAVDPLPSQCDGFAGNLVMNCGFETGDFAFPIWTLTGPTDFVGVDADHANSGNFGAFFGAIGDFNDLTQIVPTRQGQEYNIEFQLANPVGGTGTTFDAFFGFDPLMSMDDSDPFPYTLFVFNQVTDVNDAQLRFSFRHDPDFWSFDDVCVKLRPDRCGN
jgi:hypothetical protein